MLEVVGFDVVVGGFVVVLVVSAVARFVIDDDFVEVEVGWLPSWSLPTVLLTGVSQECWLRSTWICTRRLGKSRPSCQHRIIYGKFASQTQEYDEGANLPPRYWTVQD